MKKPIPVPTEISAPYWEALKAHKIKVQKCDDCGAWIFYPRGHCPSCPSDKLSWQTVSGSGTLYSFSISRVPTAPEFADNMPQKLAVVELSEGVRINSTLIDVAEEDIKIGMALSPVFEDQDEDDITLLHYSTA